MLGMEAGVLEAVSR